MKGLKTACLIHRRSMTSRPMRVVRGGWHPVLPVPQQHLAWKATFSDGRCDDLLLAGFQPNSRQSWATRCLSHKQGGASLGKLWVPGRARQARGGEDNGSTAGHSSKSFPGMSPGTWSSRLGESTTSNDRPCRWVGSPSEDSTPPSYCSWHLDKTHRQTHGTGHTHNKQHTHTHTHPEQAG